MVRKGTHGRDRAEGRAWRLAIRKDRKRRINGRSDSMGDLINLRNIVGNLTIETSKLNRHFAAVRDVAGTITFYDEMEPMDAGAFARAEEVLRKYREGSNG